LADFVDETVKDIERRLGELQEEVKRLEAARAALTGARRGPGRPRGSRSSSGGTRRRRASARRGSRGRRGGTRSTQALELVRSNPGITIPQIAEQLSIEPNYLYRVMPRLVAEGQVRREGQGWHPAG
jgi:hypothetical protein